MCGMKTNVSQLPEWWVAVPETEKAVLRNVINSIRALKKCSSPQIASAAQKWDATISCFIRTRLINQKVRRYRTFLSVVRLNIVNRPFLISDKRCGRSCGSKAFADTNCTN
jgi:hypothetical protein